MIRGAVAQAMKIMGEHFVLGQTIGEALRRGEAYATRGYSFSFDMLGEAAHIAADAEKVFADYARAIDAIASGADKPRPADNLTFPASSRRFIRGMSPPSATGC